MSNMRYERKKDGLIVGFIPLDESFSVEGREYSRLYFELTKSGNVDSAEVFAAIRAHGTSIADFSVCLWDSPGVKSVYEYLEQDWGVEIPQGLKDEVTHMIQNSSIESYDAKFA